MAAKKKRPARKAKSKARAKPAESVYQKRIRLYLKAHPGATKQQARGKKPKEHVDRREREAIKLGGLTRYELEKVEAFAERQAQRMDKGDSSEIAARLVTWAQEHGYERFKEYKAKVTRFEKQPRERIRKSVSRDGKRFRFEMQGGGKSAAIDQMETGVDDFDLPDLSDFGLPDWAWFYYH